VIGDRDAAACHEDAQHRIQALGKARPQAASLAAIMFQVGQLPRATKKRRSKR
jgi:hypothetical protein